MQNVEAGVSEDGSSRGLILDEGRKRIWRRQRRTTKMPRPKRRGHDFVKLRTNSKLIEEHCSEDFTTTDGRTRLGNGSRLQYCRQTHHPIVETDERGGRSN